MKDKTIAVQLQERFKAISGTYQKMMDKTLTAIAKCAKAVSEGSKRFNETYLQQRMEALRHEANTTVASYKQTAIIGIETEFSSVKRILHEWALRPIPTDVGTAFESYHRYGLQPDLQEWQMLSEMAQGSYIASRILDCLARQSGFFDYSFKPIAQIMREVEIAESDTIHAVKCYMGTIDEHTHQAASDLLGLSISDNRDFAVFASDFLTADNTYTRLVKNLTELADDNLQLLPSARHRLDELFADAETDQDKIMLARSIIEGSDIGLRADFQIYDPELNATAHREIASELRAEANRLKLTRKDLAVQSAKAEAEAVSAEMSAEMALQQA